MNRLISLLIIIATLFTLCACGSNEAHQTTQATIETTEETTEPVPATNPEPPKSLKILAIGNSFSVDTMQHLYTVAKAEGVEEIVLGNMFVGACTLEKHANFAQNNEPAYKYYKNNTGTWVTTEEVTLLSALQDENWDVITMQQGSADSGIPSTYAPHLDNLIKYVKENASNPDCKIMWNMTWAYQSDSTHNSFPKYGSNQQTMYDCIVKSVQSQVLPNESIAAIIPAGTTIQNARTSYLGDTLTRDGYHLGEFGRLITAYTWYAVIAGHELNEINLKSFASKSLSKQEKDLIIGCVNSAIQTPFEVTVQQ